MNPGSSQRKSDPWTNTGMVLTGQVGGVLGAELENLDIIAGASTMSGSLSYNFTGTLPPQCIQKVGIGGSCSWLFVSSCLSGSFETRQWSL